MTLKMSQNVVMQTVGPHKEISKMLFLSCEGHQRREGTG